MSKTVAVVGGGASGMLAAIVAARNKAEVTLFEANDRVGKKLLTTGNGRCNYTNINLRDTGGLYTECPNIMLSVINEFNEQKAMNFFKELGIEPFIEGQKVFPMSLQASSVLDVMRYELGRLNVDILLNSKVTSIEYKKDFKLKTKDNDIYTFDRVIIATGGKAMPVSGSDGNGYSLLKAFGHQLILPLPSLVQLKLEWDKLKQVTGVKIPGRASLIVNSNEHAFDSGDLLFTSYGISGPPILNLSKFAIRALNNGDEAILKLTFVGDGDKLRLKNYLKNRLAHSFDKTLELSLIGLLNKKMILPLLKEINLDKDKLASTLNDTEIEKLADILSNFRLRIIGDKGWGSAQATQGGINLCEFTKTLESKLQKGLFSVGEVLDVDGECGGFNLQWAWSSGFVAGKNASKG